MSDMRMTYSLAMNGDLVFPGIDGGRHCVRCGIDLYATDGPHLCRDIVIREKERVQSDFQWWAREMHEYGGEA